LVIQKIPFTFAPIKRTIKRQLIFLNHPFIAFGSRSST
jgi:hypothetical protein